MHYLFPSVVAPAPQVRRHNSLFQRFQKRFAHLCLEGWLRLHAPRQSEAAPTQIPFTFHSTAFGMSAILAQEIHREGTPTRITGAPPIREPHTDNILLRASVPAVIEGSKSMTDLTAISDESSIHGGEAVPLAVNTSPRNVSSPNLRFPSSPKIVCQPLLMCYYWFYVPNDRFGRIRSLRPRRVLSLKQSTSSIHTTWVRGKQQHHQ